MSGVWSNSSLMIGLLVQHFGALARNWVSSGLIPGPVGGNIERLLSLSVCFVSVIIVVCVCCYFGSVVLQSFWNCTYVGPVSVLENAPVISKSGGCSSNLEDTSASEGYKSAQEAGLFATHLLWTCSAAQFLILSLVLLFVSLFLCRVFVFVYLFVLKSKSVTMGQ